MSNILDNRYASALLSIAIDEGKNSEYREYIKELSDAIYQNEKIIPILSSSFISKEEKKKIIGAISKDCPFENIISFLKVIVDNDRERYIPSILKEFISLSNAEDNISEGFVYVASKLTQKQLDDIQESISKRINKKVYLYQKIDEDLIGGVKVVINDYVFDASIKHKLDSLKNSLQEGR